MNLLCLRRIFPVFALVLGLGKLSVADPQYGVPLDVGALSGGTHTSSAVALNNSNQVVGSSDTADFNKHAFLYDSAHGMRDLGTFPGGSQVTPGAVNDAGQVAGDAFTAADEDHLFLWDSIHGMQDLGLPAGYVNVVATGINASGQICGTLIRLTARTMPFSTAMERFTISVRQRTPPTARRTASTMRAKFAGTVYSGSTSFVFVHSGTGTLTNAQLIASGTATGINASGQVCGYTNGQQHLLFYSGGNGQDLGLAPGAVSYTTGIGINRAGQILVSSDNGTFLYDTTTRAFQPVAVNTGGVTVAINDGGHLAGTAAGHATLDGQDIGALPGGDDSALFAINASGQAVGKGRTSGGAIHAIFRDGTGLHDLGTLPGSNPSLSRTNIRARGINTAGQIVGISTGNDANNRRFTHAFLSNAANGLQDLGTLPGGTTSGAYAINDAGQVVGDADINSGNSGGDYFPHAFLYDAAHGMQDLGTLPGDAISYALAINTVGTVVGSSGPSLYSSSGTHAFLYTAGGGMQDLGTLSGGSYSEATGINAAGQIVGDGDTTGSVDHAFLYTAGSGMQDLGTLPNGTYSVANGINAQGQVVGYADNGSGQKTAFIWDSVHGMRDLNTLMTGTGFTLTDAQAINDKGQITGYGVNSQGQTHGFILTPLGHTHLLWNNSDARVMLWSIAQDGSFTLNGFGPYTDNAPQNVWHATAVATGSDGKSHLLWNNTDGRVMLWTVDDAGNFTLAGYGPYTDNAPQEQVGAPSASPSAPTTPSICCGATPTTAPCSGTSRRTSPSPWPAMAPTPTTPPATSGRRPRLPPARTTSRTSCGTTRTTGSCSGT